MKALSYIYIMTNKRNTILYIGITTAFAKRIWEHKNNVVEGFTKKYNLHKLVYYEHFEAIELAIKREKQLKAGSRDKKVKLITNFNPMWRDLYEDAQK